jgi:hypothetical protein
MDKKLLSRTRNILAVSVHSPTFAKAKEKNGRERNRSLLHFV